MTMMNDADGESCPHFLINSDCLFCNFQEIHYICIELFDELQSAAVQRSYRIAKSLPTTFFLSALLCHSGRYIKVFYLRQR